MGWDVKATADAIGQSLPDGSSLPDVTTTAHSVLEGLQRLGSAITPSAPGLILFISLAAWFIVGTKTGQSIRAACRDAMFTNWRLALLGATGIALSLASGYTTWDGMRNFTGEATLSLLITFGIQGVMLIIAWLIGESFATGMSQTRSNETGLARRTQLIAGMLGGIVIAGALIALAVHGTPLLTEYNDTLVYIALGIGALVLISALQWDLVQPYIQSTRIMFKTAILWVMFLGCMATSVFFSFDSLFSAIFPQAERVRAAELRAQNQVAGIVADIGGTIGSRQVTAAEELFTSEGWVAYDQQLTNLAKVSKESEGEVERFLHNEAEARNRAMAAQQERIVSSQSGQAGLASRKLSLTDELSRIKADRPQLASAYAEKKNELDARSKEIDAKRVDAMAEDKGVEGTLKEGRGPIWRQRMSELGKLQDYFKIGDERVKDAKKRLDAVETRIAQIERELAAVDGDLAKLKGDEETASQRIAMSTVVNATADGSKPIDAARMLPSFEQARVDFRQKPSEARLGDVQKLCSQIMGAMLTATPETKKKVVGLDCDPKQAVEAANVVFGLDRGAGVFASGCVGGDKLNQNQSADALFGFARKCLADSGLPAQETDQLRTKINIMELNRDDKAHRFVVTWNAFGDGNRLAYLALAIAIAIDSLVFLSGLFGANAVRSPLSDVPSPKARTAEQLEAIIENALLPDTFESATATLEAMRPISAIKGYTQEVIVPSNDMAGRARILKVLNAAAAIGGVERDPNRAERYLVRPEVFEFLSVVAKKAFHADDAKIQVADLKSTLSVALQPHVGDAADVVLEHITPVSERPGGYSALIMMSDVKDQDLAIVRRAINAGTATGFARQGTHSEDRTNDYEIHKDFYRTLTRLSASSPKSGWRPHIAGLDKLKGSVPEAPRFGGRLNEVRDSIDGAGPVEPVARLSGPSDASPPKFNAARDREKLANDYLQQFVNVLGLDGAELQTALTNEAAREAATDCWNALQSHAQRHPGLATVMRDVHRQLTLQFDDIYADLRSTVVGDNEQMDVLNLVRQDIHALEPLLLQLHELGLVQRLITELEVAAGPDNGQALGEQPLLERLRAIEDSLPQLDPSDAGQWRALIEDTLLASSDDDIPQLFRNARKGDGKSRLN
jgi:hypothetical protein